MLGARLVWLNRELEFRKMRVHELWKKGKAIQEDYKDVMSASGKLRAKAQLELNLATAVNIKIFF